MLPNFASYEIPMAIIMKNLACWFILDFCISYLWGDFHICHWECIWFRKTNKEIYIAAENGYGLGNICDIIPFKFI